MMTNVNVNEVDDTENETDTEYSDSSNDEAQSPLESEYSLSSNC